MQNLEIKLECRDPELARTICRAYGATRIGVLEQTDTYSRVANGRLKKRESPGEPAEYIFYERPDAVHARLSSFTIYSEAEALQRFGAGPLPVWVVVKKRRELWIVGNVRIHLDDVEGLGRFIEFEALVTSSQNVEKCTEAIAQLREALAPVLGEPVARSYGDMLAGPG
jgi:adenylate cyclase class IV